MREQFLRCQTTQDIMRVLAVAFQRKETTRELVDMEVSIVRALYRARDTTTDHKILGAITTIVSRFRRENLPITRYFLAAGIKFAARTRSLPGMKRYLKLYTEVTDMARFAMEGGHVVIYYRFFSVLKTPLRKTNII
jgi:hypothetical protein